MAKNPKSYTPEFKQQIVDLHCKAGKGVTELSNEYGIPKGTVSMWIKNLSPVQVSETELISVKEYRDFVRTHLFGTVLGNILYITSKIEERS